MFKDEDEFYQRKCKLLRNTEVYSFDEKRGQGRDGRACSSIHSIRGVLRPAFQTKTEKSERLQSRETYILI